MIKDIIQLAYQLDEAGLTKEADELDKIALILVKKKAGQIPAGMQRFILNTGLFGGSEYDEIEWIKEEAEKSKKKRERETKKD